MHKGRPYPYAPTYWATECFFWPGYLPWKMVASIVSTGGPWAPLGNHMDVLSSAQASDASDNTQVQYGWPPGVLGTGKRLIISVEQIEVSGRNYARWLATYRNPTIVVASASCWQIAPLYAVSVPLQPWVIGLPMTGPAGVSITLRPATYAEGGSPWP